MRKSMRWRMVSIMVAITVMLVGVAGRLAYLTVGNGRVVQAAADQTTKTVTVCTPRGSFYDRDGRLLTDTQTRTVAVLPPTVTAVTAVTEQMSGEAADAALTKLKSGNPAVVEVPSDFACEDARVFQVPVRYADRAPAVHWIGYLDGSGVGVTGLEAAYDTFLRADAPLTVTYSTDALGRPLAGMSPIIEGAPTSQKGVRLTLDSRIQRLAEQAADALDRGALLVLDSETGEILASCSRPTYSPTKVAAALAAADAPMVDRTLSAYNVGSVFKPCVVAAALKAGVAVSHTETCTGSVSVGDNVFYCHLHSGHGELNMTRALALSCNAYFIRLGAAVGGKAILDMCVRLGFTRAYRLADTLTATAGTLPTTQTLDAPAALANFSFGQGDLMLTPLHIAVMTAAIANGGFLVTPTLVAGTVDGEKETHVSASVPRRILSDDQAETLRLMMMETVASGTGKTARPSTGVAGGKTATAETGWVVDGQPIQQAWFAGFWPENGAYTVVVLRENGTGGSTDCAPVFQALVNAMAEEGFTGEKALDK